MLASLGGWSWKALCSKRNKVATPFHSNRVERRRHDAPCSGAHTCVLKPHCTASAARPGLPSTRATPWSRTALCSKRNKVAKPFHSNRMERRGHDAPCAGARTFFSNRIVHGQRGAPGRPCAPSVPRCFYFGRKTDFACQDVSAAAEKRARWKLSVASDHGRSHGRLLRAPARGACSGWAGRGSLLRAHAMPATSSGQC